MIKHCPNPLCHSSKIRKYGSFHRRSMGSLVKPTRRILGFEVSRIPASGPLAEISRRKYGPRPNERPKAMEKLLAKVREGVEAGAAFSSDEDPLYAVLVRRRYPGARLEQHLAVYMDFHNRILLNPG